jgi:cellulase/cellobiase CelA1
VEAEAVAANAATSLKKAAPMKSARHVLTSGVRNQRVAVKDVARAVKDAQRVAVVRAIRVRQARMKPSMATTHLNSRPLSTRCQAQKATQMPRTARAVKRAKAAAVAVVAVVAATVMSRAPVKATRKSMAR